MKISRGLMNKGCGGLVVVGLLVLLGLARLVDAAEFACAAGDVACLITAIHAANASGTANTLTLAAGRYTLTAMDNTTDGPTGLPSVTSPLTLRGAGATSTIIERAVGAPQFRLLHVALQGTLALEGLTLQGGDLAGLPDGGGGVRNHGTLKIMHSILRGHAASSGGGIYHSDLGSLAIANSTLSSNVASSGGGIAISGVLGSGASLTIANSTLTGNIASGSGGGISLHSALLTITNSTLTGNMAGSNGGGISSAGGKSNATLINTNMATTSFTPVGNSADSRRFHPVP